MKLWTIVHKKLSAEESISEEILVFLSNVLPFLIKTKYFLIDSDLFVSVRDLVKQRLGTLMEEQYASLRCGKLFFPEDFDAFKNCLLKAVSIIYKDLHDVRNLQDDPDATLESLIAVHPEESERNESLSSAMYGVLVELCKKLNKGSDAKIPQDIDELIGFMQELLNTTMFPESSEPPSEPPSIRESLVERLAGIGLDGWETFCFNKRFEKLSPD